LGRVTRKRPLRFIGSTCPSFRCTCYNSKWCKKFRLQAEERQFYYVYFATEHKSCMSSPAGDFCPCRSVFTITDIGIHDHNRGKICSIVRYI
jgi:hypothetical protein